MSSKMDRLGFAALCLSVSVACDSNFPRYNEVEGFRLLAITADPPELGPGGHVVLDALVVGDPAPAFRWSWCPLTLGAEEAHRCAFTAEELPGALPDTSIGASTTAMLHWPSDQEVHRELCRLVSAREAPLTAPRLNCEAVRPEIYVQLEVVAENGETIRAVRPLLLGDGERPLNHNPQLSGVRFMHDGEWIELMDGGTVPAVEELSLELIVDESAAENYREQDADHREILRVTWFSAGGEIETVRTTFVEGDEQATFDALRSNRWVLPADRAEAALHLVIRDDRGGMSFISRRARIEGRTP